MSWPGALVDGVLLGGLYALFATGLNVVFRVTRLVNLAHGELIVLGAYLILGLATALGLGPFAAAALAAPPMFVLGWLLQRFVLHRAISQGPLPPLLVTFALSIVLRNALIEGAPVESRRLPPGPLDAASVHIGPVTAEAMAVLSLASAVVAVLVLQALLYRTATGRAFRAVGEDPETARLVGLRPARVAATATGLAMIVVTLAALYLGARAPFDPPIAPAQLLFAAEAALIGGLGSLWGALAGGIILGVAQSLGAAFDPDWQVLAGHVAFLAVLLLRPRGLVPMAA